MQANKLITAVALSAALVLGGSVAAMAVESTTPTPVPTATAAPRHKAAVEAYKKALADWKIANDKFKADRAANKAALDTYKAALDAWKTANAAYITAKQAIQTTFKTAVVAATKVRDDAIAAATTDAAKQAAQTAFKAALTKAAADRDAALKTLPALTSPMPVKPELTKPSKPVRPTPAPKASTN